MDGAIGLEALADVLAEVDGEGPLVVGGLAVDGTDAAALLAGAAQLVEQAEMTEHLLHGDLATNQGEVDLGSGGGVQSRGRR